MPRHLQLRLRMKLPNDARSVPLARGIVRCALGSLDVTDDCTDDLVLAVSEACTNVLDHVVADDYEVLAGIEGSQCVLEVTDKGAPVPLPHRGGGFPDLQAETGRGIAIIEALVDSVEFARRADAGLVVRMRKELIYRAA